MRCQASLEDIAYISILPIVIVIKWLNVGFLVNTEAACRIFAWAWGNSQMRMR